MESSHLDGFLFTCLENIRYLTGFTGSDAAVLLTEKESFFLTDSRYWTQAEQEVKGAEIVHYKKKLDGIASLFSRLKLRAIGFEAAFLSVSVHRALLESLEDGTRLHPMEEEIKSLRMVKDEEELTLMRKAIQISSDAFQHVLKILKEGILEEDMAFEMEFHMKKSGADALGFDIIVASGKRSALPHGRASHKKIERGDFVLFDFGSRFQGYHSDETCTVICGPPTPEQKTIFQLVKEAHDKAVALVRPGVSIHEVDAAARDHIRNGGYGDYFGHGLGHGVGLAVHEDPTINAENKNVLQEGMVFTIEPGIYVPNLGGVRLEDMVRVTSQGAEVLTYLPKELIVV
jgi:Xaa-Pro aminopeptidase